MSDVKPHVNANTSILGRQYTFDGSLCVILSKNITRNVTIILTTKINDKTV